MRLPLGQDVNALEVVRDKALSLRCRCLEEEHGLPSRLDREVRKGDIKVTAARELAAHIVLSSPQAPPLPFETT